MNQKNKPPINLTIDPWRIWAFGIVIAIVFLIFIGRLFDFQILNFDKGDNWAAQAADNRIQTINLPTRRGVIYDRNGILLAKNIAAYNVAITPAF